MLRLTVETQRRTQLVDVTSQVHELVRGTSGSLVTLFVPHMAELDGPRTRDVYLAITS